MSTKTWTDSEGNLIATARVRRLSDAEAAARPDRWGTGSLMDPPLERDKHYVIRRSGETRGPFDTFAEARDLAAKLNADEP